MHQNSQFFILQKVKKCYLVCMMLDCDSTFPSNHIPDLDRLISTCTSQDIPKTQDKHEY